MKKKLILLIPLWIAYCLSIYWITTVICFVIWPHFIEYTYQIFRYDYTSIGKFILVVLFLLPIIWGLYKQITGNRPPQNESNQITTNKPITDINEDEFNVNNIVKVIKQRIELLSNSKCAYIRY